MFNNAIKLNAIICVAVLFLSTMIFVNTSYCNTIKKVAVCPLEINSNEDLSFLQKGLFSMLSSRLADSGKVEVLEREVIDNTLSLAQASPVTKGTLNKSKARVIGAGLDVDYVLFGSLTMFGNSVSLDISMVDIKDNMPALTFSRQAKEAGAVITELNKIAEEINFKVFGRETLQFQSRQAMDRVYSGEVKNSANHFKKFKTLLSVNGSLNGVAVGDLDGDKKNEIVVIHERVIQILEHQFNGKIITVQKIQNDPAAVNLIGVDVADINGNGRSEIFITRVNNSNQSVTSYVIEYDGSKYVRREKTYPWYFKVLKDAKGNLKLFAQEHTKQGPWASQNVFNVAWKNNSYVRGTRLRVPERFSIMSMAIGNTFKQDSVTYLYTDEESKLIVFNDSGRVEWSSGKGYGGSNLFYTLPKKAHGLYDNEYAFLQPKSVVYDMDSDGKAELFVVKNKEASDYLFKNTRVFKQGSIGILNWNEMGLSSDTLPKKFPGPVTSIDINDYDNDSKMELLVTMIKKGNGMFSRDAKSMLVVYEIE